MSVEGSDNRSKSGASGQVGQRAEIGESIENGNANLSKKIHGRRAPSIIGEYYTLRSKRLLLVIKDFKDFLQTRKLHDFPDRGAQRVENQARAHFPRSLQSFDQ